MSPTIGDGMTFGAGFCGVTFHAKRSTDSEYFYIRLAVGENQTSKK